MSMETRHIEIRSATLEDSGFVAGAIIDSEKGGTDKSGMAAMFGIPELQLKEYLTRILEEEIDGCELSLSSFLVAAVDGCPVAATAGWIEAAAGEAPSSTTKATLIAYTFHKEALANARANARIMDGLSITREAGALQFEYVYVAPEARGNNLARRLISKHLENHKTRHAPGKAQLQLYGNNAPAKTLYASMGFSVSGEYNATSKETKLYLPYNTKILMEKQL